MKTIDEAAKEYVKDFSGNPELSLNEIVEYAIEDFKAGVEFAQRWISADMELPKKQGHYFVKVKHSFPKNCNVVIAEFYEDNNTFYSESSDCPIEDVIAWRPIERN